MGDDEEREQQREPAEDTGSVRRTTPQGDELTEEHSIGLPEERSKEPYAPPRQPTQDPPPR